MVEHLKSHLLQRPFAPILTNLRNREDENDIVALEFMCILDFHVDKKKIYTRITETQRPKLLLELMGFGSYKWFYYFEYQGHGQLDGKYLKCRFCELIGPYVLILTHMTINHNEHVGLVKCAYCNEIDLKRHFNDGTLQACYNRYVQKPDVADVINNNLVIEIVNDFYKLLKELSIFFKVHTRRNLHNFKGNAYGTVRQALNTTEIHHKERKTQRNLSKSFSKLHQSASKAWENLRGCPFPIENQNSEQDQDDDATHSMQIDSGSSDEELNQNEPQPSTSGIRINHVYSLDGHANMASPAISAMSAQTNGTNTTTAEANLADHVVLSMQQQPDDERRRMLDLAVRKTIIDYNMGQWRPRL